MSDDRFDRSRYFNEDTFAVRSTAGAVPVTNKKGEVYMQKVKVQRYIPGKRPEYARRGGSSSSSSSSDDEDDQRKIKDEDENEEEDFVAQTSQNEPREIKPDLSDPRIRRLMAAREQKSESSRHRRHAASSSDSDSDEDREPRGKRDIQAPQIIEEGMTEQDNKRDARRASSASLSSSSSDEGDSDMDEAAVQRRRELMRQRALAKAQIGIVQEELLEKQEEKSGSSEESSSEESSDEDEDEGANFKPVFVSRKDRITMKEKEEQEEKEAIAEREEEARAEMRRSETLRLVETMVKEDAVERRIRDGNVNNLAEINTDDEEDEAEYESWKLRELKRMKRDRDEREARELELAELERLRNMTEEERREALRNRPKVITNKSMKGKYKFLQKYYHRGAFFLDEEVDLYKRDFTAATLEDRFDKTVLPKVMQVKNFGRSSRTKYTHLVDQDTSQPDAAWNQQTVQTAKFQQLKAGGMRPVFERPSAKKKN